MLLKLNFNKHFECFVLQISRKRDIFERKWAAFTDKIDKERFKSSDKIASKLQEFLLLAVELDDPIRLQQISDFSKKFSVARKKVNERACIAYAQTLLGSDVGLSVAEVLEVTRAANKCFKASKNRHNFSDSADSSASDSDSAREGRKPQPKKSRSKSERSQMDSSLAYQSKQPPFKVVCFYCSEEGHILPNCPKHPRNRRAPHSFSGRCRNCDKKGHIARNCTEGNLKSNN